MQNAVLITIGDEILSGNTVDTNSNFIATELKNIGIKVVQIFTISDEIEIIKNTLKSAFELGNLVITTGGLGPTRDDKTKKALAEFFDDEIALDDVTFKHLRSYMEKRGRIEILERNREQAFVPTKSKVFQNHYGTAPCMMMEQDGKLSFSLPGVPYEVKPLIKDQIVPFLKDKFNLNFITTRIVSVVGIPESILADQIENWELSLPENLALSYLPVGTRVKLRLTATGTDDNVLQSQLEEEIQKLIPIIGDNIIATSEDKIEKILGEILSRKKLTISMAESCTGGQLSLLLTAIPGSSKYFFGGVVAYETQKKIDLLNVSESSVERFTVVSEEVSSEMAKGCQNLFKTDIALSTTGVAGPGKGEDGKEVGLVYYTIRVKNESETFKLFLPHLERQDFIYFVSQKIIQDLVGILIRK
ncbi:CinA family nicotinamide mononucleotide deamidase-related protein [Chryseobacterium chendengshani]|uniref:CinA family nicotinamide mononucleotide deamidase-related protein n=1 Tax=Chryseobacterium sp. LJ668 TaxID=2864040 RepID=UPI001C6898E3|nr:CinA family nicotinamide mononucleotide deamidase-related protein [Chryseobacterium sp. LJ668]MBW8523298.1 CinA family nicotinamide mononucleotide deamidase-related protein [Chryseobacterium sp. LJ668]QYK15591.1 CinA family nicotinamide mononucleotide deamidase-related protein [Chryseobacterium sp. LJ668]